MRSRISLVAGLLLVTLQACSAEPDFDERFDKRARELIARAQTIEAEARAQLAAAREAEAAEAERTEPASTARK